MIEAQPVTFEQELEESIDDEDVTLGYPNLMKRQELFNKYKPFAFLK